MKSNQLCFEEIQNKLLYKIKFLQIRNITLQRSAHPIYLTKENLKKKSLYHLKLFQIDTPKVKKESSILMGRRSSKAGNGGSCSAIFFPFLLLSK